ncbi:MAG: hypothetical protein IAE82_06470 [Opitutaceae bacterium]|nr:hypothetical protein [Opitutaceae bacterium]
MTAPTLRLSLILALVGALSLGAVADDGASAASRRWTVYIAQDKHLDYGWCGTTTEIEMRMVALLDYYLDLVERTNARWNLDGTVWLEVYRRHRGEPGAARLLRAIRDGRMGYAGNNRVLLWGLLDMETAIRSCYAALPIADASGVPTRTALVQENPALTAGAAAILSACGFDFLGRGIYELRAESYQARRAPYPLFWWRAPGGKPLLVKWDLYEKAGSWGGYAEAHELAVLAGEKWDAHRVNHVGDRNTPDVFARRRQFIADTVNRYEAYGANYPLSSILLLGTGYDNWTCTDDLSRFIEEYNAESDGVVRLVDARYQDFFEAVERELREKRIELPTFEGTFGVAWEEWGAHLAAHLRDYREAARLLRLAEANYALRFMEEGPDEKTAAALANAQDALLDFAEHDCGGVDLNQSANSVDVRAGAAARALAVARGVFHAPFARAASPGPDALPEDLAFSWRGGRVTFSADRAGVVSLVDRDGRELVPPDGGVALGEFVHRRYGEANEFSSVSAEPLPSDGITRADAVRCLRGRDGVEISTEGVRSGFVLRTRWLFHEARPWIDITYDLEGRWASAPQTAHFCFPLEFADVVYRYDQPGTILRAGAVSAGGDDLPGANDTLWGAATFASAYGVDGGVTLVTPDTVMVQFGSAAAKLAGADAARMPAAIVALPMMNLTRADHQLVQGGQTRWQFRYRLVLNTGGAFDPVAAIREAQQFATPAFVQAPGLEPAVAGLARWEIAFDGGPVTAVKVAEDNRRVIVRLWNVRPDAVQGSLRLPPGWAAAEFCDVFERPLHTLEARSDRVTFNVEPRAVATVALIRGSSVLKEGVTSNKPHGPALTNSLIENHPEP